MSNSYPQDIAALAAEHGPFLRSLARALVKDPGAADDLAQETWTAALSAPMPSMERPRAWLSTILRRKAVSRVRRENVRGARPLDPGAASVTSPEPGPLDTAAMLEREQLLLRAMEALREPYRTAIYLRYREGIGAAEIAKRTAAPVKTVRTRLHRGLSELREELDTLTTDRHTWLASLAPLAFPASMQGSVPMGVMAVTSIGPRSGAAILTMKTLFPALAALVLACIGVWQLMPGDDVQVPLVVLKKVNAPSDSRTATVARPPALGSPGLADPAAPSGRRAMAEVATGESSAGGGQSAALVQTEAVTITVKHADGSSATERSIVLGAWENRGRSFTPRVRITDSTGGIRYEGLDAMGSYYAKDALGGGSRPFSLANQTERHFELVLHSEVEIVGTVVDAAEQPTAGAGIWSAPGSGNADVSVRHATSGPDGSFTARLPVDGSMQAILPGFVPSPMRRVSDLEEFEPGRFRCTLHLREAGSTLLGLVVDEDGEPVPGAVVVAGPEGGSSMGDIPGSSPIPLHVWTDEGGHFRYPAALPAGTWPIVCYAEGFATRRSVIHVTEAPLGEQRIVLSSGVTLSGRIFLANGAPAGRAFIEYVPTGSSVHSRPYGHKRQSSAGTDGAYEFLNIPLGGAILRARSAHGTPLERVLQPIDIPASGDQVLRVDLSDAPFIAGHVIDQDGQPMAEMEVRAADGNMMNHPNGAITDSQGAFRLTSLEGGLVGSVRSKWDLSVRPRGRIFGEALGSAEGIPVGEESVVIHAVRPIPRTAYVEGRFEGADGFIPSSLDAAIWRLGVSAGLYLDVDLETGAFRYGPVAPGTFTISGTVGDERIFQKTGIVVAAGETVDVGTVRAGAGGQVRVGLNLATPPGVPVDEMESLKRNVNVALFTNVGGEEWLGRDGDDWFSGGPIEPGTWRVEVVHSDHVIARAATVEIAEGATAEVELEAFVGRSLRVKLELPGDGTWTALTVKSHWPDGTVAAQSEPIQRAGLSNPNHASVEVMAPIGSVRFVVEMDASVGHDETLEIPAYPARFRRVTLNLN